VTAVPEDLPASAGPVSLRDWEPLARERLDPATYHYIAGGAGDERTLRDNVEAFSRVRLVPRMLRGTAAGVDTSTVVLGVPLRAPILVAPFAYQGAMHADGELATARAAAAAGLGMCLSTLANRGIEEVAEACGDGLRWFQLYPMADPGMNAEMIARASAAGYSALIVTVDLPPYGVRERELHAPFVLPPDLGLPCIPERSAGAGSPTPEETATELMKLDVSWEDIEGWVASAGLPVLVKGVLSPEDARIAADTGVAGLVVSNHGGRQLDTAVPSIEALPRIVEVVGDRVELLLDSGVRRGTDVLKAVALGARAVLIGRPVAYGLSAGGEAGVRAVLEQLTAETENAMGLCGCRTVAEIDAALVA
jgi:4-hydroxymandelate oxidase